MLKRYLIGNFIGGAIAGVCRLIWVITRSHSMEWYSFQTFNIIIIGGIVGMIAMLIYELIKSHTIPKGFGAKH